MSFTRTEEIEPLEDIYYVCHMVMIVQKKRRETYGRKILKEGQIPHKQ